MEIVVKGRNTEIADRFRTTVEEKLAKVEQLAPRAQRVEVELTREKNPRLADQAERVEITVRDKGPVIRAEAKASDRYGALDLATGKLVERLRRARDRRKNHHRYAAPAPADALVPAPEAPEEETAERMTPPTTPGEAVESQLGDSPVVVRQKCLEATPMTVDQALYEMELVGHPFFLFIDDETGQPCVAYHRHGWTYGVIRLNAVIADHQQSEPAAAENAAPAEPVVANHA
ncbi:ribosome hibernation-promoting factor, HPF/YfiA family [Georgenia thermotolerans]|uniref:Ribosome hibernation promoting factor n=1 Tax=Georgenia thermotolerans TaxID=527326 RepID=A0A7J5UNK4_9MICO|nr:ribosome-associated translation inhibitor RaiA [Georgenia thermotolerans]KAE8763949.1 ribosome-associated translation inhibitor RaiA [Georgenia thermotolerans]